MLEVEIIVKGQIEEQWSGWFDNLTMSYPQKEQTVLSGQVEDQAALHGLISRLWDLGLPLISVWTGSMKPPEPVFHIDVRAIIERESSQGREIILQIRNKPDEVRKRLELPGGRVAQFEPLVDALRREVREGTGLELTRIEGLNGCVQSCLDDTTIECLAPFAAYQTLRGQVASLGIYFRCRPGGEPLPRGDATECIQWVRVAQIAEWLQQEMPCRGPESANREARLSCVDRAGLLLYLKDQERSA